MLYSCGSCGSTISISTILFSTLSLSDLENLCYSYDYTTYSSSPFYDSVLENGEYRKGEDVSEQEEEDEQCSIAEEEYYYETDV